MQPDGLRSYAAAKAETAAGDYAACGDKAPAAPTAVVVLPPATARPLRLTPPQALPPIQASPIATPANLTPPTAGLDEDGLVGSLAASDLARQLDPVDRRRLGEATQQTLENGVSGQLNGWRNPFSRNAGTVVASRAFRNAAGQWCRGVEQSITVVRETRSGRGTACRRNDGFWDIQP